MENEKKWKRKILIVDDSKANREILRNMLCDRYEILEGANGEEALEILEEQGMELSLLLLDFKMPIKDGLEVLACIKRQKCFENLPVVMISAVNDRKLVEHAYNLGAVDYVSRPFDKAILLRRVENTLVLSANQAQLNQMARELTHEKQLINRVLVNTLSHIVEFRNGESGLHVQNIQMITELLLRCLVRKTDAYNLAEEDIQRIITASALHDIGKVAIDEKILNKCCCLTELEFEQMKMHSIIGADMLKELHNYQEEPLIRVAYEICRWHHERYDGKGYPDEKVGEEIPISAQVVSLADAYEALIRDRCYQRACSHEKAMEMIQDGECGSFNPLLLECFAEVEAELRELSSAAFEIEK